MIDLLRQRRSVRQYLDKTIEPEKIKILKEAALRSPTSRNLKPWHFIFVDDRSLIKKLSSAKQHGSAFLKNAPLVVVVLGDSTVSDVWIEDCSIASILLQLTAQSIGLGSCWVQIRLRQRDEHTSSEKFVLHLLDLPEHLQVHSMIGFGYPDEHKAGIPFDNLSFEKIHSNRW